MKKILLTGSDGQVGQELKQTLTSIGEVIAVNRQQLDLTSPNNIKKVIQEIQPNIIVNSAAYTAVDKAENEADLAFAINGIAPTIIAEEANKIGAFLLHISTDYVFDGGKNTPYLEILTYFSKSAYLSQYDYETINCGIYKFSYLELLAVTLQLYNEGKSKASDWTSL